MSYPEWPLSLPHAQQAGDGNGPMFRDPIETEMEDGDIRRRRRPGDDLIRQRLAFRFTATEAQTWADFVRTTLGNGTARFIMPVSVDGGACELRVVQIIGVPNYDGRSGSLRMYSFEVWVFPADMVPPPVITVFDYWILGTGIAGWTAEIEIDGVVHTAPVSTDGTFILDASSFLTVGDRSVRLGYAEGVLAPAVTMNFAAGVLDALSASLYAVHGARRLLTSWKSPVLRARRTDNVEKDFYGIKAAPWLIDSTGVSIAQWAAGTSAYLANWYDQKGLTHNATQATGSAQPRLVNAGVLDVGPNGQPAPVYSGAQYLDVQNAAGFPRNVAACTYAAISRATAATGQAVLSSSATNSGAQARALLAYSPTSTAPVVQARSTDAGTISSQAGASVTSGAWTRLIGRTRYADGAVDITVNGTTATNTGLLPAQNTPDANAIVGVRIGTFTSGTLPLTGGISASVLAQSAIDVATLNAALALVMP